MNKNISKIFSIMEIANEMNRDGFKASFYEDYSGRGMFGRTCIGVVVDDVYEFQDRCFMRNIKIKPKTDDMGKSTIVYFPTLSLSEKVN